MLVLHHCCSHRDVVAFLHNRSEMHLEATPLRSCHRRCLYKAQLQKLPLRVTLWEVSQQAQDSGALKAKTPECTTAFAFMDSLL